MSADDIFQRNIDKLFQGLSNVFGIADGIPIAWFNDLGKDHDPTLDKVLRICSKANLKLNRQMLLQVYQHHLFREIIP